MIYAPGESFLLPRLTPQWPRGCLVCIRTFPDPFLELLENEGPGSSPKRSATLENVETPGNTNFAWFMESERQFASQVSKLPFDHHELMAMVARRALLFLGNTDYEWLADESGYVSSRAAHEVYETFGIGDRMGFTIGDGHGRCRLPDSHRFRFTNYFNMTVLAACASSPEFASVMTSVISYMPGSKSSEFRMK